MNWDIILLTCSDNCSDTFPSLLRNPTLVAEKGFKKYLILEFDEKAWVFESRPAATSSPGFLFYAPVSSEEKI